MTQETSGDLGAFMRRHTEMRIPSLPTHCMSEKYQHLHPRTWPFPGIPSRYLKLFDEGDPTVNNVGGGPPLDTRDSTIPGGISRVTRKRHADYDKHHEGGHRFLVDLLHETHCQTLDLLGDRGPVYLERYIRDMTNRLQGLSAAIDEEFLVVKPRSAKEIERSLEQIRRYPNLESMFDLSREKRTTRVCEARRFLQALQGSTNHRSGTLLQGILPDHSITGECRWRLSLPFRSVTREASYTKQAGFDLLNPLTRPRTTKCVSIPVWGYEFGLSHLPLDITLDQVELIAELCYIDLKNRADRICETHALLYFRTVMAEVILQEHGLYGEAERWTREDAEKRAQHWLDRDIDDTRSRIPNVQALLQCVEEILGDEDQSERVWQQRAGVMVPNVAGLYRAVKRQNLDLLEVVPGLQGEGTPISVQAFRNYFQEYFSDRTVDTLREEVHP